MEEETISPDVEEDAPVTDRTADIAVTFFGELFMIDQLARNRISRIMPEGMELSHLSVLNHLANSSDERSPAQLARAFHVTRGAMTNTLNRLEQAGHIHIRPDWEDARRKFVSISPAGRAARERAAQAIVPLIADVITVLGPARVREILPFLRELRSRFEQVD